MPIDYSKYGATPDVDYSKYGAVPDEPTQPSQGQSSFLGNVGNVGKGFLDALSNTFVVDPLNIAGRLTGSQSLQNIPQMQTGQGTPYTLGNIGGDITGFIGGGAELDALRGAMEGAPLIGKLAQALGGSGSLSTIGRQGLGSAAFGALTNPQDTGKGALEGGAMGAAFGAIPGILGGVGDISSLVRPQQYSEKIINTIGNGQDLTGNAQSFAMNVKNAFDKQKAISDELYAPVTNNPNISNNSIYSGIKPEDGNYSSIDLSTVKSPDIQKYNNEFNNNPTFDNAHNLQSLMGEKIRELQSLGARGTLDTPGRDRLEILNGARSSLLSDIRSYLSRTDPSLADQYSDASQYYLQNVAPYKSDSFISQLANGTIKNPSPDQIISSFKNPEENVNKIVSDLGPQGNNQILYNSLGKANTNLSPDKLSTAIQNLDKQGMTSYISPQTQSLFDSLNNRILAKKAIGGIAGGLGGASLAGHLGLGAIPELTSAAIGGGGIPLMMQLFKSGIPNTKLASGLSKALQNSYRPANQAIQASVLPQSTQGNQ